MSQLVDTQRSLLFRRQRFVARHRKRPVWLRLWRPFAQALLLVGMPTLLCFWVLTAPQFTLREVAISPLRHIDQRWVEERLVAWSGRPLVSMPMAKVEEELATHPWLASVRVHKQLPDRLEVEIEERVPVLVLRREERVDFVDAGGRIIAPYDAASAWRDLPVVEGSSDLPALAGAADVQRQLEASRPGWGRKVTRIEALNDWDFVVETSALPFRIVVSAEQVGDQVAVLSRHLDRIQRAFKDIERVDLRVRDSIVVKPVMREE